MTHHYTDSYLLALAREARAKDFTGFASALETLAGVPVRRASYGTFRFTEMDEGELAHVESPQHPGTFGAGLSVRRAGGQWVKIEGAAP